MDKKFDILGKVQTGFLVLINEDKRPAGDIAVILRTKENLKKVISKIEENARLSGLIINEQKLSYMELMKEN